MQTQGALFSATATRKQSVCHLFNWTCWNMRPKLFDNAPGLSLEFFQPGPLGSKRIAQSFKLLFLHSRLDVEGLEWNVVFSV